MPQEPESAITPASILHGLVKRRWLVLTPFFVVPLIVMGVVLKLPDEYTSSAVFNLIQSQVSRQYVDPISSGSSSEMIRSVTRQVLSAPRLSGIVDSFGLFPEERGVLNSEQLGEKLRSDILVVPVDQVNPRADYTAFRMSFTASDPKQAQQVLSQLSSLFVEVNLKERGSRAQTTTSFLKSQMDQVKERMDRQEQVVVNIKVNRQSDNPALNQAKFGAMSDLRMQLQNTMTSISRLNQQRSAADNTLNVAMARLMNERTALLKTYTAKHPLVEKKDADIALLQNILSAIRKNAPIPSPESITDPILSQLATQLETNNGELERLDREAKTLREEIARYQAGMTAAASPVRQHELERAQQDYDVLRQEFADLQAKYFRSQMAADLEQDQSGQTFQLIDPPSLPAFPSGPKRMKISLASIAVGLFLGIALALLFELKKPTFLRETDLRKAYQGALVVALPVLSTPAENRSKKVMRAMELVAGVIMVAVVSAAEYYIYLRG